MFWVYDDHSHHLYLIRLRCVTVIIELELIIPSAINIIRSIDIGRLRCEPTFRVRSSDGVQGEQLWLHIKL
jgi:hypothetical protein